MSAITAFIKFIKNLFKYHKKKILLATISATAFFLLLFPYDDLSDFVTSQVSKATNNQVFLSFDEMDFSLVPTPGLEFINVSLDTPVLPTMKVKQLSAVPSLVKLLTFKLGLNLSAQGLWGGDLSLTGELEKNR